MRFHTHGFRRLAVLLALLALPGALTAEPTPAQQLLEKLRTGKRVVYAAFGDSITYGVGVGNRVEHCFVPLFARALQAAYPRAQIETINLGYPGITAGRAVNFVETDVLPRDPDLVTLQFGGNDSRTGVDGLTYRHSLDAMVNDIRAGTHALIIVCQPPMEVKFSDFTILGALRYLANVRGVSLAPFDDALKRQTPDFRGLFPWKLHPHEHQHVIMAQSLYATLCETLGVASPVSARVTGGAPRPDSRSADVTLELSNRTDAGHTVTVALTAGEQLQTQRHHLAAHARDALTLPVSVTADGLGFARQFLWCTATVAGHPAAWDARWLRVSPVVVPGDAVQPWTQRLDATRKTFGRGAPTPEDVSGRCRVWRGEGRLHFEMSVTDDIIVAETNRDPYEADCVEFFFDLREPSLQGAPYYCPGVYLVFINPLDEGPMATTIGVQPLPDDWREMVVNSRRTETGYLVHMSLPIGAFPAGEDDSRPFGFDFAIDDADDPDGREWQLLWSHTRRGAVNPSLFGAMRLAGEPGVRATIW